MSNLNELLEQAVLLDDLDEVQSDTGLFAGVKAFATGIPKVGLKFQVEIFIDPDSPFKVRATSHVNPTIGIGYGRMQRFVIPGVNIKALNIYSPLNNAIERISAFIQRTTVEELKFLQKQRQLERRRLIYRNKVEVEKARKAGFNVPSRTTASGFPMDVANAARQSIARPSLSMMLKDPRQALRVIRPGIRASVEIYFDWTLKTSVRYNDPNKMNFRSETTVPRLFGCRAYVYPTIALPLPDHRGIIRWRRMPLLVSHYKKEVFGAEDVTFPDGSKVSFNQKVRTRKVYGIIDLYGPLNTIISKLAVKLTEVAEGVQLEVVDWVQSGEEQDNVAAGEIISSILDPGAET